ncbi:MAG: copper-binding protein [Myxococcota bacterium]
MQRLVGIVASVCALGCGIPAQERYEVRGTIEAVDASQGIVDIAHEAIPGFMPAMTMSFDVALEEIIADLARILS